MLIPRGTTNGDIVCYVVTLEDEMDLEETAIFQVHVRSDDLNVLPPQNPYVDIVVHDVTPPRKLWLGKADSN